MTARIPIYDGTGDLVATALVDDALAAHGGPLGDHSWWLATGGYAVSHQNGRSTYLHRLAWEHTHGPIPLGMEVDHVNGDPLDCRHANLRLLTRRENVIWRGRRRRGETTSRYPGVWRERGHEHFRAAIMIRGRRQYLGSFAREEDAGAAYLAAAQELEGASIRAR